MSVTLGPVKVNTTTTTLFSLPFYPFRTTPYVNSRLSKSPSFLGAQNAPVACVAFAKRGARRGEGEKRNPLTFSLPPKPHFSFDACSTGDIRMT